VFQRLHSTAEFEGTGIGLSIVKNVSFSATVAAHGPSRYWGEGAAAFFFQPADARELASAAPHEH